jgi:hypothetical protein
MAQTDSAVLTPGVGHIFTKAYSTGATWTATELATYGSAGTIPATWNELGHTDLDSILTFAQDGGDTRRRVRGRTRRCGRSSRPRLWTRSR